MLEFGLGGRKGGRVLHLSGPELGPGLESGCGGGGGWKSRAGPDTVFVIFLVMILLQAVRLSHCRRRLCFSGFSSEVKPLPSERSGSKQQ